MANLRVERSNLGAGAAGGRVVKPAAFGDRHALPVARDDTKRIAIADDAELVAVAT